MPDFVGAAAALVRERCSSAMANYDDVEMDISDGGSRSGADDSDGSSRSGSRPEKTGGTSATSSAEGDFERTRKGASESSEGGKYVGHPRPRPLLSEDRKRSGSPQEGVSGGSVTCKRDDKSPSKRAKYDDDRRSDRDRRDRDRRDRDRDRRPDRRDRRDRHRHDQDRRDGGHHRPSHHHDRRREDRDRKRDDYHRRDKPHYRHRSGSQERRDAPPAQPERKKSPDLVSTSFSRPSLPRSNMMLSSDGSKMVRRHSPGPDMNKVRERLERLRKQGCTAAYQQIMSGGVQPQLQQFHQQQQQVAAQLNIPKFYNPAAINITKIADQERKKKLLWGNKSNTTAASSSSAGAAVAPGRAGAGASAGSSAPVPGAEWKPVAAFEEDSDGKMAAKFLRLMGVKNPDEMATQSSVGAAADTVQRQRQMFDNMEQQYEQARVTTHTQRGFGLGYTAQYYMPKS